MVASKVFGLIYITFVPIELAMIRTWPHPEISGAERCSYWPGNCLLPVTKLYGKWGTDFVCVCGWSSRGKRFSCVYDLQ